MTIVEWLVENMGKLRKVGVDSPRRDCLVLLEDTLNRDRAWVISHPEYSLQDQVLEVLSKLIDRRLKREPLAYIRGKAWFYGKFFNVTPDVMIPRSESESFIDMLKKLKPQTIVDVGTGSGCLAITAKLEIPNCKVLACDIDLKVLDLAKKNAKKHKVDVEFITSDLLTSIKTFQNVYYREENAIVLITNLPYVPDKLITSPEILFEPKKALFSGKDGLNHYRNLWKQIFDLSLKPQHILTESLENQHKNMIKMAKDATYKLKQTKILVQHFEK